MEPLTAADVQVGDVAQLRKPHPCGSDRWDVVRIGADIGLKCRGCGHRVLLPRSRFAHRLKRLARPSGAAGDPTGGT